MSTLIVAAVLLSIVFLAIRSIKKNKHSCGGGCSGCSGCKSGHDLYSEYHSH